MNPALLNAQRAVIAACSVLLIVLGASVIFGWHARIDRLIQVDISLVPMQYNAALAFLLCGVGVIYLDRGRSFAGAAGFLTSALGFITALQYVSGLDFGVDELFMPSHITAQTSHAGRMAPNTALAFLFAGGAIAVLALMRATPRRTLLAEVLSCLVGVLGVVPLMGYLFGVEAAYGWAQLTRMAVHTAIGLCLLGTGLLLAAWHADRKDNAQGLRLVVVPAAIGAFAVVLSFWQALAIGQDSDIDARTAAALQAIETSLVSDLGIQIRDLTTMGERWARAGRTPNPEWVLDTTRFLADHAAFDSLAWVDTRRSTGWIFPEREGPERVERDVLADGRSKYAMEIAQSQGRPALTKTMEVFGREGLGLLAIAPTRPQSRESDLLTGTIRLERLFNSVEQQISGYVFEVYEDGLPIHRMGQEIAAPERRLRTLEFFAENLNWQLRLTPTLETVGGMKTKLPNVVLILGTLGVLLLAVTIHLAQMTGRRASRLASSNRALEQVNANLEHIALYDGLTGLGNRNLFRQQIAHMLLLSKRRGEEFALLTFDLDGFKQINDTLGHEAGDRALCLVAERLRRAVRESDPKFRLGGDEFAVLLGPGIGAEGAATVAQKIVSIVATPLSVRGEHCRIGLSTGIAVYPQHGADVERLMRCADAAMYEAKHSSSSIIRVASDDSPTGVLKALHIRRAGPV